MRKYLIVLFVTLGLVIGFSSHYLFPKNLRQTDFLLKSQEPKDVALKFYEAQRTSSYSEAWNYMSPGYQTFWKSFEQYVDFMTKSKTLIPEYNTVRLENEPAEKRQDGLEHVMLWYQTTNKDYYFFNLIKINLVWKVYKSGGVLHSGELPS